MNREFSTGDRVEFDSEHGPQRGTIIDVKRDINNGEAFAVIEVDHVLSGITWSQPLSKLQREALAA